MQLTTFNLTTEPWIKVIRRGTNDLQTVSLIDLFKHAQDFRQLAGDMRTQDLALFRLLLAILTTVYSRYTADGEAYKWLTANLPQSQAFDVDSGQAEEELLTTWETLYRMGHFSTIVTTYLQKHAAQFDLLGKHTFYQVTADDYDALMAKKWQIALGKGTVAIKQLNRRVSESNNTPAVFSPKAGASKNQLSLAELTRWLITYQNYTGTTDKAKVKTTERFSSSAGWLYKLDAVYADSTISLFEDLMLNLVLTDGGNHVFPQRPVWECDDSEAYVVNRKKGLLPNNLAELYTTWSRILHIEWDDQGNPTIFSAGIPMFTADNAYIEPMTTWKRDKKTEIDTPVMRRDLTTAMWRNFGSYVGVTSNTDSFRTPGIVQWLRLLRMANSLPADKSLALASTTFISGGPPANLPIAEFHDDIQLVADVLLDNDWQTRIEKVVKKTQIIGKDFCGFVTSVAEIKGLKGEESQAFANPLSNQFYSQLNQPFKDWLASLKGSTVGRTAKIIEWQQTLHRLALEAAKKVMDTSSSRDIRGIYVKNTKGEYVLKNVFIAMSCYQSKIKKDLEEG